jgi:hypothetical protein
MKRGTQMYKLRLIVLPSSTNKISTAKLFDYLIVCGPTFNMVSSTITFSIAFLTAMAAAAPAALEGRQPGAVFVSVGDKFAGPGCTDQTLIFADPIFGNGNQCQPLDRSGNGTPIVSYKTLSVSQGCSGK